MIEEMHLRDLGVIADAALPLGPGFTAITGETGAGKTMVVTGLGLLLGQRADSGVVRSGAAQAEVSGVWLVPEAGPVAARVDEAGGAVEPAGDGVCELHTGRTVTAEGRSRASVGGRAAPAGVLADLAGHLVVVHGQSEQLRLRSAVAQREALDRFGADPVQRARRTYREVWDTWRTLESERATLVDERDARADEAAALRADLDEIEKVAPQPGEDVELAARAERLGHVEELRVAAATAREALSSESDGVDVAALVGEARRALERGADSDADLAAHAEQIAEIGFRVAEIAVELSSYLADLEEDNPAELDAVEERRAALTALARRHGGGLDDVLALAETGGARLADLESSDARIEELTAQTQQAASALDAAAAELTAQREAAAVRLGEAVTAELHALAMPDARLEVAVSAGTPSADGRDDVALLLAPHPGASPRPVARSASGGELSRVMLAIEVVIGDVDPVPTFVFDEIDAGIGGAAAIEVGRRLARLAEASQVIVVTHLAQVAGFANNHLSVVKENDGSVTASSVRRLEGEDREAEMARLLSGLADSTAALDHARELLELSRVTD
ncbi:DNA repair protein RecN [Microbacterium sp. LRZ72]|uniref:DNA repair protein RecN n=1 Tax=Microbacterium sp. LRZ72 TaxID=2942481 RepID=UPI0029A0ACE7|nr:DNA repair protein RecN [Microbacterium sp. LRZ72]MDX2375681.1 DNA repair protein RecN [Microbacterium sp. LRZ72]